MKTKKLNWMTLMLVAASLALTLGARAAVDQVAWLQGDLLEDNTDTLVSATPMAIKWSLRSSIDPVIYAHSLADPTRLTVKQDGDYLVGVTLPVEGTTGNRPTQAIEVYVNGQAAEGTLSQSSYVRNSGSHSESSDHVHALIPGLKAGDVLEVKVHKTAGVAQVTTLEAASLYVERIDASRSVFSGIATAVVAGESLNLEETEAGRALVWAADRKNNGFGHTGDAPQITLEAAGDYLLFVNVPMNGSVARASVGLEILLDGQLALGGRAQQGYIRNSSGHTESSVHWSGLVRTTRPNQVLTVQTVQRAGSGSVTIPGGKSASLFLERIDSSADVYFATARELVDGPNWNPTQKTAIKWSTAGGIIDARLYGHNPANAHQIQVKEAGSYLLVYNDALQGGSARNNPRITVEVNGTELPGAQTKTHYIRQTGGHEHSSASLVYLLEDLAANDVITVNAQREGGGGETLAEEDALLFLQRKKPFAPDPNALPPSRVASFKGNLFGFEFGLRSFGREVDPASIRAQWNGQAITPEVSQQPGGTQVAYDFPALAATGSRHLVQLSYADKGSASQQIELPFVVTTAYTVLLPEFAVSESAINRSQPGFAITMHQVEVQRPAPRNGLATVLDQLSGTLLDANTGLPAANVVSANFYPEEANRWDGFIFRENQTINYNQDARDNPGASAGNFGPDRPIPGIPGFFGSTDDIAMDARMVLELKKGFYTFGVNSDDGFMVSSGVSPKDLLARTAGLLDGGRGAADSFFNVVVEKDGLYPFRLVWWEGGGGASVEFFHMHEGNKILINDPSDPNAIKAYRIGTTVPYISKVAPAVPELAQRIEIELINGDAKVVAGSVKMSLDGKEVAAKATQSGEVTTVVYEAEDFFPGGEHRVLLTYDESTTPPFTRTRTYRFRSPFGQKVVLQDRPIAYWRLAETGPGSALSEVNTGLEGTYESASGGSLPKLGVDRLAVNTDDTAAAFESEHSQLIRIPDHAGINTAGPYRERTIELWFKPRNLPVFAPGAASGAKQVLFEEGGATRGLNLYLAGTQAANPTEAELYFQAWNLGETQWGGVDSPILVKAKVNPDTVYHAVLVLSGDDSGNLAGTLAGYLNGQLVGKVSGVDLLHTHTADIGIAGVSGDSFFHDEGAASLAAGHFFDGVIDEVAVYGKALTAEQVTLHFEEGIKGLIVPGAPQITRQPAPQTVLENSIVEFSLEFSGTPPWNVTWFKNGAKIGEGAGLGSSSVSFLAAAADNGAVITAEVTNELGKTASAEAKLTVQLETIPPRIVGIRALGGSINQIIVTFDEPLLPATATATSNYKIAGLTVTGATLSADSRVVTLSTTPQTFGTDYVIEVSGLKDTTVTGNALTVSINARSHVTYQDEVLLDLPDAYWPLGDRSGTEALNLVDAAFAGTYVSDSNAVLPELGAERLVLGSPNPAVTLAARQNNAIRFPDSPVSNTGGPYKDKTIELWFKANRLPGLDAAGVSEKMVLWEQGGLTRGISLYLSGTVAAANPTEAEIYFHAWNTGANDGAGSPWGGPSLPVFSVGSVASGKVYHAVLVLTGDGTGGNTGTVRGYLNGELVQDPLTGFGIGAGLLYNHGDNAGLGAVNQNVVYHDGNRGIAFGDPFDGSLDEFALYNKALSPARIKAHYQAGLNPVELETPAADLLITGVRREGGAILVEWEGTARLQSADQITGPFSDVPNAKSPYQEALQTGQRFFRLAP